MSKAYIRLSRPEDSAALRDIYAQSIDTPVTFECALPTVQVFSARMAEVTRFYPWLVCEAGAGQGRVAGYAYAHRHMEREAYQWNAVLSVYLDAAYQGLGLGKRLYAALIHLLREQGLRTVYGVVTVPNPASEGLHRGLGFEQVALFCRTGYKGGRWHDVAWFEKHVGTQEEAQGLPPPVPVSCLCPARVQEILGAAHI